MIDQTSENHKTETNQKRYKAPSGLIVLYGTHFRYTLGEINYRQLILIAYADRYVNHYSYRFGKKDEEGNEAEQGKPWTLPATEMAEKLHCDQKTLKRLLNKSKKKKLLDWKRPYAAHISVWTPDKKGSSHAFKIAESYLDKWREGKISGPAMILLANISDFWWRGKDCYAGDKWLGEKMGIKTNRGINKLLKELEDKKMIKREHRDYQGKPKRYILRGEAITNPKPKKEKETQTGLAHNLAKQLTHKLKSHGLIVGEANIGKWEAKIKIILGNDLLEPKEVEEVLGWYGRIAGNQEFIEKYKIPLIYQPGQLEDKYIGLMRAHYRWRKDRPGSIADQQKAFLDSYFGEEEGISDDAVIARMVKKKFGKEHDEQSNGRKYEFSPELWAKFGNPPDEDEDDEKDKYVDMHGVRYFLNEADGKYYLPDQLPSDERDEEWEEFLAEYKKEKEAESKKSNGIPKHRESRLGNGNYAPRICVSRRVEG